MTEDMKGIDAAVERALELFEQRQAEKAAKAAEKEAERAKIREEEKAKLEAELAEKVPAWKGGFATKRVTERGDDEEDRLKSYEYWLRTGDDGYLRKLGLNVGADEMARYPNAKEAIKALQEGDNAEGGYLVPPDYYTAEIIARRDKMSIVRQCGARIFNTSRDKMSFAVEDADMARFTLTAEEGTYNDTDRAYGQKDASIYKFTRVTKISEELLSDAAHPLMANLATQFAREEALTENYYLAVGTGSGQPEGVFTGGTSDAVTDTGSAVSTTGFLDLWGALGSEYRNQASWLSHGMTQIEYRKLRDTSNWTLGDMYMTIDAEGQERLINRPYFTQDDIGRASDNGDTLLLGDFYFYAFVENSGLIVTRNPYLYEATGQVGFFARKRFGGVVLQAEAFQILKTAA